MTPGKLILSESSRLWKRERGAGFFFDLARSLSPAKLLTDDNDDDCCPECGKTVGACCLPSKVCVEVSADDCESMGGVFQGGSCEDTDCTTPGACCLPDGSCITVDRALCKSLGGMFAGGNCADTDCSIPDRCPTEEECEQCPDSVTLTVNIVMVPFNGESCDTAGASYALLHGVNLPCVWGSLTRGEFGDASCNGVDGDIRGIVSCDFVPPRTRLRVNVNIGNLNVRIAWDSSPLRRHCPGGQGFSVDDADSIFLGPFVESVSGSVTI